MGVSPESRKLPVWEVVDEIPTPPFFSVRGTLKLIGPGAILLGISIGSGEWLVGPAVTAQFGGGLLWVALVSILFQVVMNMEFIRYTLYTGEPVYTGFMRTWPGKNFWAVVYSVLAFLQLGWPGWALAASTAIVAALIGEIPGDSAAPLVQFFSVLCFVTTIGIVSAGSCVERTMEYAQWFFIIATVSFLAVIAVVFTSSDTWLQVGRGLVNFGDIPPGVDWALLGAFAAYAGAGGVINGTLSNWFRDKGFGMGKAVGYIPTFVGGKKIAMSGTGKIFRPTAENFSRFRTWQKFAALDQYALWAVGSLVGMVLPAVLSLEFIPRGTKLEGFGIAAYQAEYLSRVGGEAMWFVTLLVGFWVLYSTQLGITDCFTRMVTDILWSGSKRVRSFRGGEIRSVYYGVLLLFSFWGVFLLLSGLKPMFLIVVGANVAALNFVVLGVHALIVNHRFLPRELRPSLLETVVVLLGVVFYGFFFANSLPAMLGKLTG